MKNITYTLPGKIILYFLNVISVSVLAFSIAMIICRYQFNTDNVNKEEVKSQYIQNRLVSDSYTAVENMLSNYNYYPTSDSFRYEIDDYATLEKIISNVDSYKPASSNPYKNVYYFRVHYYRNDGYEFSGLYDSFSDLEAHDYYMSYNADYSYDRTYLIKCYADIEAGYSDTYAEISTVFDIIYYFKNICIPAAIISFVLSIVFLVLLFRASARVYGSDEIKPGFINYIPSDIMFIIYATVCCVPIIIWDNVLDVGYGGNGALFEVIVISLFVLFYISLIVAFLMDTAGRIKSKTLFRNTLIYYILKPIVKLFRFCFRTICNIPIVWKTALICTGITIIDFLAFFLFRYSAGAYMLFFVFEKFILGLILIYTAYNLRVLENGIKALEKGDLDHKIETSKLFLDFEKAGKSLNSLGKGMTLAVEEQLKSERMKTELITNVSHDLKTPITSIINYSDLISREKTDNPKITEYSEVLTRQSNRLKRLIEDLVEASKASTGNLDVELAPCDASVFISQVDGEFAEKLEAAGLSLVTKQPENEAFIMADGRRMWRVFDNLMNNICKYSQKGTRVYLTLLVENNTAVFTFKNTSSAELNVSADELMERFVRGDSSRNTEGNGLGLSIAKSMVELQNGDFKLVIDGDLFKAIVSFPIIGNPDNTYSSVQSEM